MSDAYPTFPAARAYLYGHVDTDAPGYRRLAANGVAIQIAAGYRMWPDHVAALNTALATLGGTSGAIANAAGTVTINSDGHRVTWTDRLGWLLGFDVEAGATEATGSPQSSRVPPPGCIPLLAAATVDVDRLREEKVFVDRFTRGHGHVWGGADVWRWRIRLHHLALRALKAGWCLGGQVTVSRFTPAQHVGGTAFAVESGPTGYCTGYVVGLSRGRWLDEDTRTLWEGDLILGRQELNG